MSKALTMATTLAVAALPASLAAATVHDSDQARFQVETVASGLEHPWAIAFLPDGSKLVTERAGRLRIIRDGKLADEPVAGVPGVAARGQGATGHPATP